ncbi:spore germination protein [Bacillus aquiflavi]|uniref:Spore germination protein n=2 Tax=Bacillus aquiflavi TaxID=2672567 RepID=A0A6B3VW83_9BACI|nr:spore germination protein [Bacillus aquiflavi]NEY82329.1 spore germination protein [Bacillus aquiflavi]UAC50099.1 spore germination protein [Bacillus aquiflavi]
MDEQRLRELFHKSPDVIFQKFCFGEENKQDVLLIKCEGMIDNEALNHLIYERLEAFFQHLGQRPLTNEIVIERLHAPSLTEVQNAQEIISGVFSGKLLLYFMNEQLLFSADISKRPQRKPEETTAEVVVNGPRDDFIEDITINIALIRKRLRTNSLCIEKFEVGRRTLTTVAMLYIDDIANEEIVNGVREKIANIDVDAILSGQQLMELIHKSPRIFPRHDYTGRPDFAVHSLLSGRIVVILDGSSYVNIVPANLFLLLKAAEDYDITPYFSSFERIMRVVGLLIATFIPALWLALTTFHQNQIPLILLATVVESRKGLPFPSAVEAIIMLLIFELFREAGLRLPIAIGQTLSVFGGLIIGDAAIRAGLTSPAMLVVIAGSTIATFTFVNQSLVGMVSLLRIFSLVFAAFLGLYGFLLSIFIILIYLASVRVFGIPYMEMAANLSLKNILTAIFRLSAKKYTTRPEMFHPNDAYRKGDNPS